MKLGDIGEEMVATAVALAKEKDARIEAITVVKVPRERALDAELSGRRRRERRRVARGGAGARRGERRRSCTPTPSTPARSAHAIVDEAERRQVDLIVLGSSPRWRRQSRFFSPTVDHVLQHAHCEVLVVAFPDGVFDE